MKVNVPPASADQMMSGDEVTTPVLRFRGLEPFVQVSVGDGGRGLAGKRLEDGHGACPDAFGRTEYTLRTPTGPPSPMSGAAIIDRISAVADEGVGRGVVLEPMSVR